MTDNCVLKFREEITDRLDIIYNYIQDNNLDLAKAELLNLIQYLNKAEKE